MMKLNKNLEYGLIALKYICDNTGKELLSAKEISMKTKIPYELTAKILQKLCKAEIISSKFGFAGGYELKDKPGNINFLEIMNALDYNITLTDCQLDQHEYGKCERFNICRVKNNLNQIQKEIVLIFKNKTLKDIT